MNGSSIQSWALELSNQIKAIQTSWSDDDPTVRREMLQQELKRALERLPGHEREERLAALRSHFPVPEGGEVRVIEVEKPVAARQVTADEALELLVKAGGQLSDAQRRSYSERLVAAGYKISERRVEAAPVPVAQPFEKLPDALSRKLGLKGEIHVYPTQVFNVLLELVDFVLSVSAAASEVLVELRRRAAESPASREEDLKTAVGLYLGDQPGGSAEKMRMAVARTRMRLGGFLQVPAELPRDLCEKAQSLSPETIIETVKRERTIGVFDNEWNLYWKKYAMLWNRDQWSKVESSSIWEKKVAQSVLRSVDRVP